jgi:hypothetical protein
VMACVGVNIGTLTGRDVVIRITTPSH